MRNRFIRLALVVVLESIAFVSPLLAVAPLAATEEAPATREIEIIVEGGYQPSRISVAEGEHIRLKFIRKEYGGCTRELVVPSIGVRRELPPNKPVIVHWPALPPGDYEFRCGMNMIRGVITVVAK